MRLFHAIGFTSSALAALQVNYAGLNNQMYYKGFNIRSRHPIGPDNPTGAKNYADWEYTFRRLKGMTGGFNAVRIYSTQDTGAQNQQVNHLESVFPLAIQYDLMLLVGLYLDEIHDGTGQGRFQTEFNVLKETVNKFKDQGILSHIAGISVGNEDAYQNWTTANVIADEIKQVKAWLESEVEDTCTPVGHTDTWDGLKKDSSKPIVDVSDFLVANIFPYWENVAIDVAKEQFARAVSNLTALSQASNGVPVWLGETGWPRVNGSESAFITNAVASPQNMQQYWSDIGCEALNRMNAFYYIDEDVGQDTALPQWGIFDAEGKPFIDLACSATWEPAWATGTPAPGQVNGTWNKPGPTGFR